MNMLCFRHLGLLLASLGVLDAQCPYAKYNGTFTSDPAYCKLEGAVLCMVDSQCKAVPDKSYFKSNVTKDTTATDILLVKSKAEFIASLPLVVNTYIQFYGNGLRGVGNLSNSTLALLDFENNSVISYDNAVFPASLTRISIAQNNLSVLPTTIPYGQLSEFYGWENKFTALENVDFRNANEVKFTSIPTLTLLKNVSFSTKLTKLYFDKSDFTTFLVDMPTYQVLQKVATFQVSSIDVSVSCVAPNKPMPLKTYTLMMALDPFIKDAGTSTVVPIGAPTEKGGSNIGVILGGIAGGVVLVGIIVGCVVQRRRESKAVEKTREMNETGYRGYTANTLDDTAASGGILRLDVE
ncbi:hypothetical protein As57867_006139, partial [Aphanomyces stellatus]